MPKDGIQVIAIVGGGPAGLMAAEALSNFRCETHLFDSMPSFGRKFLMAGKSGLNLTHGEEYPRFLSRYGERLSVLKPSIDAFTPNLLRQWASSLGIETFVGSSGRVFPTHYKASPLLRAWLGRLDRAGVQFHRRHRWVGLPEPGRLAFQTENGPLDFRADACILALGGTSWPRLGSDGAWQAILEKKGITIAPFRPSNCGFSVDWSDHFRDRFAGEPVKTVRLQAEGQSLQGEFVISRRGVEGSAIYTLSAELRDALAAKGQADLTLDLLPDLSDEEIFNRINRRRGSESLSNHLRKTLGLKGVKMGLLRECTDKDSFQDMSRLVKAIKALPVPLRSTHPIEEAISVAGGIPFEALDKNLMLTRCPGLFCAGEMLDWEAPTGGYLLNACMATGRTAGLGAAGWLGLPAHPAP